VIERLAWVAGVLFIVWLASRCLRIGRSGRLRAVPPGAPGQVSLIVVVSSRCATCPAQKHVVAGLRQRYPAHQLRVEVVDADGEPARARSLGVRTVPSTLLSRAGGDAAYVNHGFTPFEALAAQIDDLAPQDD
jgi:thioredoxin-like negative regulator of GroEL